MLLNNTDLEKKSFLSDNAKEQRPTTNVDFFWTFPENQLWQVFTF